MLNTTLIVFVINRARMHMVFDRMLAVRYVSCACVCVCECVLSLPMTAGAALGLPALCSRGLPAAGV